MNNRRKLLVALGASALAAPFRSFAQQQGKVWRIGYLAFTSGPDEWDAAFQEQLRTLGYVEGRNLVIEFRWASGNEERVQEMAAELVRLNVDAIATRTSTVALAAKRATSTIPIVMTSAADPVGVGLIASLAHPGGNVTGLSTNSTEVTGRRLQLLRAIVPKSTRFAVLVWKNSAAAAIFLKEIRAAARKMGITPLPQEINTPEAIAPAFNVMQRERAQTLIVQTNPFAANNRKRIAELAAQHRLPSMFESRIMVDSGGLISYGANFLDLHRRAARYMDKILQGAKPADLPVEQPTKFEMIINLKTARALGITIPQSVLLQADEVIQ
jgi:putative ABC transport system substrate-binding protein